MEYRFNFVVLVVMGLVYQLTGFRFHLGADRAVQQPGRVDSRRDRLPVWAAICWFHAPARGSALATSAVEMEWLVRRGEFDRMLVRPMSPLVAGPP